MAISYKMIFLQRITIARHLAPGHNYSSYFLLLGNFTTAQMRLKL
jgi:hypothetical protein